MFVYFEDWFDCGKCDLRMPPMTSNSPSGGSFGGVVRESPERRCSRNQNRVFSFFSSNRNDDKRL